MVNLSLYIYPKFPNNVMSKKHENFAVVLILGLWVDWNGRSYLMVPMILDVQSSPKKKKKKPTKQRIYYKYI